MPLQVLLPLVVVGIGAIAMALHLLGLSKPRRFADTDQAIQAWLREAPQSSARDAVLSTDNQAALIALSDGFGLVWCFGADTVARPLGDATYHNTPDALIIRFSDMGAPQAKVNLSDQDREIWHNTLGIS